VLEVHALPKNADEAMKSVVRVPTGTDTRSCPNCDQMSLKSRHWESIAFDLLRQICPLILMIKTFEEIDLIGNLNQDKPLKSECFRLQ